MIAIFWTSSYGWLQHLFWANFHNVMTKNFEIFWKFFNKCKFEKILEIFPKLWKPQNCGKKKNLDASHLGYSKKKFLKTTPNCDSSSSGHQSVLLYKRPQPKTPETNFKRELDSTAKSHNCASNKWRAAARWCCRCRERWSTERLRLLQTIRETMCLRLLLLVEEEQMEEEEMDGLRRNHGQACCSPSVRFWEWRRSWQCRGGGSNA